MVLISPSRSRSSASTADLARERVDALVREHLPLVSHLVREVLGRVPTHVDRDDLMSAGMMALTVSAQGFDATRGVPFAAFASIRIRGALTDELRSMDWASRSVRSRARDVESMRGDLTAALGRVPTRSEIAEALGLTVAEVNASEQDVRRAGLLSIEALTPTGQTYLPSTPDGPESVILQREQVAELRAAVEHLPARLRLVVEQYFFEHRKMASIAEELGVTESRVSQLRSEALLRLRTLLHNGAKALSA